MSSKDKWVRRFSVDESSKHKNGFTIYKITSVLFPIASPEAVTTVSVWKRYSDVQRLHKSMRSLHAGLHLRGAFPTLPRYSYFKRFQKEVIEERAKTIKTLLEFIAEHRLLFTSTELDNFLQTGYPEPESESGGVINAIRSSLHLPIEETPPLEYQTDDDDARTPMNAGDLEHSAERDMTDFISQIPIYEPTDVELRKSPDKPTCLIESTREFFGSLDSLESLGSIDSDMYEELSKVTTEKPMVTVRSKTTVPTALPDLITFDAPSTSKFDDYHTMGVTATTSDVDTISMNSHSYTESRRSSSRSSLYSKRSVPSLSGASCATRTEDTYVFEASYMLNLAAKCSGLGEYARAFHYYKCGIEKMLIGVQTDPDPQRKALVKEKINKYLLYAENLYKNHLSDTEQSLVAEEGGAARAHATLPVSMLRREYGELAEYRVLGLLGHAMMLVMHTRHHACYAMKVIQKIPNNLTEFDEYFLQRTNETRQPILPTVIPYMVPLHAYVETANLLFLILSYAPGENLFDYIKKFSKSTPNTPRREVNLENVFSEPKLNNLNAEFELRNANKNNSNLESEFSIRNVNELNLEPGRVNFNENNLNLEPELTNSNKSNSNLESGFLNMNKTDLNSESGFSTGDAGKSPLKTTNSDIVNKNVQSDVQTDNNNVIGVEIKNEVSELVLNSQKLLLNVDKVLSGRSKVSVNVNMEQKSKVEVNENINPQQDILAPAEPREFLPPSAICKWAAEILTALESLHNCGVIYRDLNPSNILLGEGGQVILTYTVHQPGLDSCLAKLRTGPLQRRLCIAPELFHHIAEPESCVCDYWSFGAIMYQLLCSVPLSHHHRTVFTSHTLLYLPEGLTLEEKSLLSQLLTYEPAERLGAGSDGIEEIKRHPYFRSIDWQAVYSDWIVPD